MEAALITFFLNKASDVLHQGWKISTSAQKQLQSLINEAEYMNIFLENADLLDLTDEVHRLCLNQVREVLFDAEDSIEKYMLQEGRLRHLLGPSLKKMQDPFKSLRNKHRIYNSAKDLKLKAADAMDNLQKYNEDFRRGSSSQTQNDPRGDFRNETLLLGEAQLVGIEGPRGILVQRLLEDKLFKVAAIHGMPGIGKTTLAKSVFRDEKVIRRFPCRVWANVSESYDINELLKMIVEKLYDHFKMSRSNMGCMKDLKLKLKMKQLLRKSSYVLVLNDVWREELLHSIKDIFYGTNGRLIVTTRDKAIADSFTANLGGEVLKMNLLSKENSLKLFWRTLREDECPPGFAEVSEEVLKKCERLPLAIKVVSGLFIAKPRDLTVWKEECDRLGKTLEENQGELEIMTKIFLVSIDMLPRDLKSCLLYLSIFPPDHPILCSRLIRLWISEGFVKQSEGTALEKANEFLKNLWLKNLIEVAETTSDSRMKTCRIHTILHKIIVLKSKDVWFASVTSEEDRSQPHIVRRLSIHGMIQDIGRLKRLRSLFVFEQSHPQSQDSSTHSLLSKKFRMLHVLDLQDTSLGKIPKKIFKYKHLRYLSLRGTKVTEIPESIGEFQNLETLDLKHTPVRKLPPSIGKLKLLHHLLVYRYEVESPYPVFHFRYGFKAPPSIGDLKSLQKLCIIDLSGARQSLLNELGKLNKLRRLGITKLRKEDGPVLCSSIEKMENLDALSITSASEEEFLDLSLSLAHLPMSLKRLYLTGRLGKLPEWIGRLCYLVKLFLKGSQLSDDPLDFLKDLAQLEHLELQKFYNGETLKFRFGGFRKLRLLGLDDFPQLTGVEVEGEGEGKALQALEKLTIQRCSKLRTLPKGIEQMTKLRVLELFSLDKELIDTAQKDGQEYWKIEHILKVHTTRITENQQVVYECAHTGARVTNVQMPRSRK